MLQFLLSNVTSMVEEHCKHLSMTIRVIGHPSRLFQFQPLEKKSLRTKICRGEVGFFDRCNNDIDEESNLFHHNCITVCVSLGYF